jgi:hypothetical protein
MASNAHRCRRVPGSGPFVSEEPPYNSTQLVLELSPQTRDAPVTGVPVAPDFPL